MHKAAMDFLEKTKMEHLELFEDVRVFEVGSLNINGQARGLFVAREYVGVDWRPGIGVDTVGLAHKYAEKPDGYFDVAISTETFEHDAYWKLTLEKMVKLLRPGGSLILTMAAEGREPHALETGSVSDYYQNLQTAQVLEAVSKCGKFKTSSVQENKESHDLYCLFLEKL